MGNAQNDVVIGQELQVMKLTLNITMRKEMSSQWCWLSHGCWTGVFQKLFISWDYYLQSHSQTPSRECQLCDYKRLVDEAGQKTMGSLVPTARRATVMQTNTLFNRGEQKSIRMNNLEVDGIHQGTTTTGSASVSQNRNLKHSKHWKWPFEEKHHLAFI